MPFAPAALGREQMAQGGLLVLDLAGLAHGKALGGAAIGLQFAHRFRPLLQVTYYAFTGVVRLALSAASAGSTYCAPPSGANRRPARCPALARRSNQATCVPAQDGLSPGRETK